MTRLTPELVLRGYAVGVFPMATSRNDTSLFFVDPEERGVIPLDHFHIPRSLRKVIRRKPYDIRCNTAFEAVLDGCGEETADRPDTWINDEIRRLYLHLARQGCCHSIEAWQDETLVGGLYGIALHGAFFGESMFSRAPNASKIALVHLVARLRRGGFTLLDCQFINEHLRQFGAVEIERGTFQRLLADALRRPARFYCEPDSGELVDALLQSTTHTS